MTIPLRSRRLLASATVLLVVGAGVGVVAFRTPVAESVTTAVAGTEVAWSVSASGPVSRVYPDGTVAPRVPGDTSTEELPIYTALVDTLLVELRASGTTEPVAVTVDVVTAEGLREQLDRVVGSQDGVTMTLPVDTGRDVAEALAALTGGTATGTVLELTPEVDGRTLAPLQVTNSGRTVGLDGSDETVGAVSATEEIATVVTIAGITTATATARVLALAVLAFSAVFGAAGAALWLRDPVARIALLHRAQIVDVEASAVPPGPVIRTRTMGELVRLAKRDQRLVLHQSYGDGQHRWLLPDTTHTYEFRLGSPAFQFAERLELVAPAPRSQGQDPVESDAVTTRRQRSTRQRARESVTVIDLERPTDIQVATLQELHAIYRARREGGVHPIRRSTRADGSVKYTLHAPDGTFVHTSR